MRVILELTKDEVEAILNDFVKEHTDYATVEGQKMEVVRHPIEGAVIGFLFVVESDPKS